MSSSAVQPAMLPFGSLGWFKRELAPTGLREIRTAIMVGGTVLCVIISMALQVPEVTLSAYMVFFISQKTKHLTILIGLLGLIGATIGIGETLLLYKFTYGHPELRIPGMAMALFLGMWLSRVFVLGPVGFIIGFVASYGQSVAEQAPSPELLVRGVLWIWVAIAYGVAVTVVLNSLFLPDAASAGAEPPKPKSLFVPDAFTNPAHVHFALKVTFAAMFCYIFYSAIDWTGIHTAFITCTFRCNAAQGCAQDRRLRDRRSTRALHHRFSNAAHGNHRVARRRRRLCLCHRRLGCHRIGAHFLRGFTDRVRFLLQRLPRLCARHRSR